MNGNLKLAVLLLPVALLALGTVGVLGTACELAVNLNLPLDGSVSDVLDCGICADVSADAIFDAADVSVKDSGVDAHD